MNNSKRTVTPIVQCNNGSVTNVGAQVNHSTSSSHTYGGVSSTPGHGGSSTFYAGTSRNVSNSSTVGVSVAANTKGSYNAGVSFEKKF